MNTPFTFPIDKFMNALIDFEAYSVLSDFNRIFGNENGEILWSKFLNQCNSNTTLFYRILDDTQKEQFERHLNKLSTVESVSGK